MPAEGRHLRALLATAVALLGTAAGVSGLGAFPHRQASTPSSRQGGFEIRFTFRDGETLYYVIENEIRQSDHIRSGGLGIGVDATVNDRLVCRQAVDHADDPAARLEWTVERYEVRERTTFTQPVDFDSVRDLYPMNRLAYAGSIPGSKIGFSMDPRTGNASQIAITPGATHLNTTARRTDKSLERLALTPDHVARLLADMGAYYFPEKPVAVGDVWQRAHTTLHPPYGTVRTTLKCELVRVVESGNSREAVIEIKGEVELLAPPTAPALYVTPSASAPSTNAEPPVGTSQPAGAAAPVAGSSRGSLGPPASNPAKNPSSEFERSGVDSMHFHGGSQESGVGAATRAAVPRRTPVETSGSRRPSPRPVTPRQPATAASVPATGPATQPVVMTPTTSVNRPVPARPSPSRQADQVRKLTSSLCVGTVRFDIDRGELAELTLTRNIEFSTEMTSAASTQPDTFARQGTSHVLRIRRSRTAPPVPIIEGGRKPPPLDPNETTQTPKRPTPPVRPSGVQPGPASSAPTSASQPGRRPVTTALSRPATTRPGGVHSQGRVPASQPRPGTPASIPSRGATPPFDDPPDSSR